MANEFDEGAEGEGEQVEAEKPSKGRIKIIIIIAVAVIVLSAGGFIGYKMFLGGGHSKGGEAKEGASSHGEANPEEKLLGAAAMVKMEPFIANLTDKRRYVKITLEVEVVDKAYEEKVVAKTPNLRDAIIILLSSKSSETLGTIEGKLQLKDEILVRLNQVMEKEVFKNIYFTDFVMQ